MIQSIVSSFPVYSPFVPGCIESIIDKKVSGVALNTLEKLVDWLCTWFYCFYNTLLAQKMARVHDFTDQQVRLFDCTREGAAGIDRGFDLDYVTWKHIRVFLHKELCFTTTFKRAVFVDYVIVKDDPNKRSGWYQIIMQKIARRGDPKPMGICWMVNTKVTHQMGPEETDEAYLVES